MRGSVRGVPGDRHSYRDWVLENLLDNSPVNQIKVPEKEARLARTALERMLEVSP